MDEKIIINNYVQIKNMVNSHIQQASPGLENIDIPLVELKELRDFLEGLEGQLPYKLIEKKIIEDHPQAGKLVVRYIDQLVNELASFEINGFSQLNIEDPWGNEVCKVLDEMGTCKSKFLQLIFSLYENSPHAHKYVSDLLSKLLQFNYLRFDYFGQQTTSGYQSGDNYRIFNYEIFLYTCTFLVVRGFYSELKQLLDELFQIVCIKEKSSSHPKKEYKTVNFLKFNILPITIDNEHRRAQHGKLPGLEYDGSLLTELLVDRHRDHTGLSLEMIKEVDVLLFYISLFRNDGYLPEAWMPLMGPLMGDQIDLMLRGSSRHFFEEHVKPIFKIETPDQFREEVQRRFQKYAYQEGNIKWLKIRRVPYPEILNLDKLCTQH